MRIAVASSGSNSCIKVEQEAVAACLKEGVIELTVIHISETSLVKYGEFDQLASGSCKDEFIAYIQEQAQLKHDILYSRVCELTKEAGLKLHWIVEDGEPLTEICKAIESESIDQLFMGNDEKPSSFFSIQKSISKRLKSRANCIITTF